MSVIAICVLTLACVTDAALAEDSNRTPAAESTILAAGEVVAASSVAARIEAGDAPLILDVRSSQEFTAGHVPGARNLPYDQVGARLDELPADKGAEIVVYCRSGRRAEIAEGELRDAGYSNVRLLEGHWAGWQASQAPSN